MFSFLFKDYIYLQRPTLKHSDNYSTDFLMGYWSLSLDVMFIVCEVMWKIVPNFSCTSIPSESSSSSAGLESEAGNSRIPRHWSTTPITTASRPATESSRLGERSHDPSHLAWGVLYRVNALVHKGRESETGQDLRGWSMLRNVQSWIVIWRECKTRMRRKNEAEIKG